MRYTISFALATAMGLGGVAAAEVPNVVTDMVPVQGLVAMVMGDLGQPVALLERGANAHSFQMRPSQAAMLAGAGLVVWVGPQMTPWLDQAITGTAADVAQLRLIEAPGTYRQDFGAAPGPHDHEAEGHDHAAEAAHEAEGHDHAAEAAHEAEGHDHAAEAAQEAEGHDHAAEAAQEAEGHDHDAEAAQEAEGHDHAAEAGAEVEGHEGHDHAGLDPHAWLDPANGALWLDAIAAELARLDPENAATYGANAAAGKARIAQADQAIAAQLAPVMGKPFVVFHDAYGYFAGHYGLTVAGSVALGDAASPGAAHLTDLRETAAGGGALCLFPEAGHDPKLVTQLAEATGATVGGVLDPEGAAVEPGPGAYVAVLQGLADVLAGCLTKG